MFSTFYLLVRAVDLSWLVSAFERTLKQHLAAGPDLAGGRLGPAPPPLNPALSYRISYGIEFHGGK